MPDTIDTTSPDYWAQQGSQVLQRDQAEQLRHSLMYALPVNPDAEAQTRRYAAAAQVPMDTARAMPDQIKQQAQLSEFDAQVRISAIVDACFRLIVDGVSAPSWTRGGCAQARGSM